MTIKTFTKNDILVNKYTNVSNINNILEPHVRYYVDKKDQKIDNKSYNETKANEYLIELKKQAPHEEKIDVKHENYDYVYARTNAEDGYPVVGDQLDMLYHDISSWKDHIKEVKKKYPKK